MDSFKDRVSTPEGLEKELHSLKVKMAVGVLQRAEDSYMWPYIEQAIEELSDDEWQLLKLT